MRAAVKLLLWEVPEGRRSTVNQYNYARTRLASCIMGIVLMISLIIMVPVVVTTLRSKELLGAKSFQLRI